MVCDLPSFFGIRSPLTPDLSTDEFPDDIPNDINDISHELELNQEDFSDVLPRLPDDLQDFDLFEGTSLLLSSVLILLFDYASCVVLPLPVLSSVACLFSVGCPACDLLNHVIKT